MENKQKVTVTVNELLSSTKAAKYLGISRMTLWRWVKAGTITPVMFDHAYFHIKELMRVKDKKLS